MNRETINRRTKAIRTLLNKNRIDCLVLTKPANVTYATGFLGADSWALIAPGTVYLLTDSRYTEQARGECPCCRIIQRSGPIAAAAAKVAKRLKSVKTAYTETSTSIADFRALKKALGGRLRTAGDIVEPVRTIKDQSEVAAIGAAARIAGQALGRTLTQVKPGMTENELAGLLDLEIRRVGGHNSFETIVAFGANASRAHHQPSGRKLRKSDSILIDFGARYDSYCCDLTRCFVVGKPNPFYERVYNSVRQAQAAAIEMVKAGVDIQEVDKAARRVIKKAKLPVYGHGTGHGLGLEIHEGPVVSKEAKGKLDAGAVVTIEPGVYIPGKLGVRIEDDILVTERGHKILSSACPHSTVLAL
ncbi:MAG: M24 family metallopeptidase [Planctomycetota bacterium]|jgi:Xaa-Pro aminopeptidase